MDDPLTLQFLSLDLFFQSRVEGHCRTCGFPMQQIARLDLIGPPEAVRGVIVDLEFPGLDFQRLGEILAEHRLPAIGYGSHIKTHLFEAARDAGLEKLFSRGEIDARGPEILSANFSND